MFAIIETGGKQYKGSVWRRSFRREACGGGKCRGYIPCDRDLRGTTAR